MQVIGCLHSWKIWEKFHEHFDAQMQARGLGLSDHAQNYAIPLLKVILCQNFWRWSSPHCFVSSMDDLATRHEHLEVWLQELPRDHKSIFTLIISNIVPLQI